MSIILCYWSDRQKNMIAKDLDGDQTIPCLRNWSYLKKLFGIRKVCANSWYYILWLRSFNHFDPEFFFIISVCLKAFCVCPTSVFMSRSTTTGRWIRQQTAGDKIHCYNLLFYTFIINIAVSTITKNIRWGNTLF